jgi:hypothetical protein
MKSASDWWKDERAPYCDEDGVDDWVRAIQADALEAAALRCQAVAARHASFGDDHRQGGAEECVDEVRKLKPEAK